MVPITGQKVDPMVGSLAIRRSSGDKDRGLDLVLAAAIRQWTYQILRRVSRESGKALHWDNAGIIPPHSLLTNSKLKGSSVPQLLTGNHGGDGLVLSSGKLRATETPDMQHKGEFAVGLGLS